MRRRVGGCPHAETRATSERASERADAIVDATAEGDARVIYSRDERVREGGSESRGRALVKGERRARGTSEGTTEGDERARARGGREWGDMVATRRAVRAREAMSDAGEAEEAEETSPVRSMREDDEDDGDEGTRGEETATESHGSLNPSITVQGGLLPEGSLCSTQARVLLVGSKATVLR